MPRSRRDEYAEASRAALIAAARRRSFGKFGYDAVALQQIADAARLTTGAIYHHFGGKRGLFEEVARGVERHIMEAVVNGAQRHAGLWERLTAGIDGLLEVASNPGIQQIVFRDAPVVIGVASWREIEGEYAYGLLRSGLHQLQDAGLLAPVGPDIAASILLGALIEAATVVANSSDKGLALVDARLTISMMLRGLRSENPERG